MCAHEYLEKHPRLTKAYREFSHKGFAIAVYEEFIPFFGLSLLAYYFPSYALNALWYGMFLALTGHFMAHIGISLYVGKFIPSVITSVICLPISILILVKTSVFLTFDVKTIVMTLSAETGLMVNMKLGHVMCFALGQKFK